MSIIEYVLMNDFRLIPMLEFINSLDFRFNFTKMFYVVDHSQSDHFQQLKYGLYYFFCLGLINKQCRRRKGLMALGETWADTDIEHLKFGLVRGMSTRRGNASIYNLFC